MGLDEGVWQARGRDAYASDRSAGFSSAPSADAARKTLVFLFFDDLGRLSVHETEYALALAIGAYLEAHREEMGTAR